MYKENPMRTYSANQTGAKTQLGGVRMGFFNDAYHVGIAGTVKNDPILPTSSQRTTQAIKRGKLTLAGNGHNLR